MPSYIGITGYLLYIHLANIYIFRGRATPKGIVLHDRILCQRFIGFSHETQYAMIEIWSIGIFDHNFWMGVIEKWFHRSHSNTGRHLPCRGVQGVWPVTNHNPQQKDINNTRYHHWLSNQNPCHADGSNLVTPIINGATFFFVKQRKWYFFSQLAKVFRGHLLQMTVDICWENRNIFCLKQTRHAITSDYLMTQMNTRLIYLGEVAQPWQCLWCMH